MLLLILKENYIPSWTQRSHVQWAAADHISCSITAPTSSFRFWLFPGLGIPHSPSPIPLCPTWSSLCHPFRLILLLGLSIPTFVGIFLRLLSLPLPCILADGLCIYSFKSCVNADECSSYMSGSCFFNQGPGLNYDCTTHESFALSVAKTASTQVLSPYYSNESSYMTRLWDLPELGQLLS